MLLARKWLLYLLLVCLACIVPTASLADSFRVGTTDQMIQLLRKAVQDEYKIPGHDVLVLWNDQDLEKKLKKWGNNLTVEVSDQDLRNLVQRPSLMLKVMDGSLYKGRVPVRVKVDGWLEVYKTQHPVRQNELLSYEKLTVERVKLSKLPRQYVRVPFVVEDYMARQDIPEGTLLQPTLIKDRPLVQRGDTVKIFVVNGKLRLLAQGEALDEGARNQQIRVKIKTFNTDKLVYARVSGLGEVTLTING